MSIRLDNVRAAGRHDSQLQFSWAGTPQRARAGSSSSRPGRGVRPQSRPLRGAEARSSTRLFPAPRACVAEPAAATTVRLTERGVALILLAGLLLLVTAATVIGLTAFRVTSSDYLPYGQSQGAQQ